MLLEGRERRYTILNECDYEKYVPEGAKEDFRIAFNNVAAWIGDGRVQDGKHPNNTYIVINTEEPYINEIIATLKEYGHFEDIEECHYCDDYVDKVRPSPFLGDVGSSMCKNCWDMTKEEYEASHGGTSMISRIIRILNKHKVDVYKKTKSIRIWEKWTLF